MEIVRDDKPAELISIQPWLAFLNGLAEPAVVEPIASLLRGEPVRLLLCGSGALVSASEFNLDLLRALCTTISGRFAGGLEDELPTPSIRYHPALHHCDSLRAISKAEAEPDTAFFCVAMDSTLVDPRWKIAMLVASATLPYPALALLKWLHSEWNLSDVAERLAVLERWAHSGTKPVLKAV
jgi:hypothetical protein